MMLLITNETRQGGGDVQLTRGEWLALKSVLERIRNGPDVVAAVDPVVPNHNRPFRVRLAPRLLQTMEQAAARL